MRDGKLTERFELVDLLKCSLVHDEKEKCRIMCSDFSDRYKLLFISDIKDCTTHMPILEGDIVHVTGELVGDDIDFIGEVVYREDCLWVQDDSKRRATPLWSGTRTVEKLSSIYLDPTSSAYYLRKAI